MARGSLKSQFYDVLNAKRNDRPYDSRHKAKLENVDKEYIFSEKTLKNYKQSCGKFAEWARATHPGKITRTMESAEQFVPEYLKYMINKGYSPYTIASTAAALGKAYGKPYTAYGVDIPTRSAQQVKRGRGESSCDKRFSVERNKDFKDVCESIGLRRNEISHLKGTDIYYNEKRGAYYVHVSGTYAKGGREREVLVFNKDKETEARVVEMIKSAGDKKVFDHVHTAANIHRFRANYAKALYEQFARPLDEIPKKDRYECRGENKDFIFDRKAVSAITRVLGHSPAKNFYTVNHYLLA